MITSRAFAKINLYLAVGARRADGYHEIETVFQSVDLADNLTFEPSDGLHVDCSIPELSGAGNLAQVAAEQLRVAAGVTLGARIRIEKHIPVAAGLAGGSADAAATLFALNSMWRLGLSTEALASVAARIGSDVPFCLFGGTAFGSGSGTTLTTMPPLSGWLVILAKPAGTLLAGDVYAAFDRRPVAPKRSAATLRACLDVEEQLKICGLLENTLEPAVLELMPQVRAVKATALNAGAACALVSGSGPTVYALTRSEVTAAAIAAAVESMCEFVHICSPADDGVELVED